MQALYNDASALGIEQCPQLVKACEHTDVRARNRTGTNVERYLGVRGVFSPERIASRLHV